jgi:hypothetical protein
VGTSPSVSWEQLPYCLTFNHSVTWEDSFKKCWPLVALFVILEGLTMKQVGPGPFQLMVETQAYSKEKELEVILVRAHYLPA